MASTTAGTRLTEAHRLAQARLGADTVVKLRGLWPLLDPTDLDGSLARWLRAAVPTVQNQRKLSARLAAQYLSTFRAVELGMDTSYSPIVAEAANVEAVTTSLTVTGPAYVKSQIARLVPFVRALTFAEAAMAGAGMRHALNGGRETVLRSVKADKKAFGWMRVVSGDPCHFCAMLAGRGPVYKKETVGFEPHDDCACAAEPMYRKDAAWPPGSEKYAAIWQEAKGMDGDTAINFRRLIEGR